MGASQSLPNIPTNPLWRAVNQQTNVVQRTLEVAQVLLTSAQLLALKTTPILLTVIPGNVNEVIVIESVSLKYTFGTVVYTLNAGTLKLFYGAVANAHAITADLSGAFLTAGASRAIVGVPLLVVASDTIANNTQQGIWAGNDGAANYTLGNGTVAVTILFSRTTL